MDCGSGNQMTTPEEQKPKASEKRSYIVIKTKLSTIIKVTARQKQLINYRKS